MLAAVDQGGAANAGDGVLAVEIEEQLIAHHGAAGGEGEGVEARFGADRRRQRRDVQRLHAFADDLDVIDMRLVADEQFERGVDLIVASGRAFMALDQHGAGALLHDHERAHEARRRRFRGDEDQMQRPFDGRAGADADDGAVAHQRGIERDGDIACRRELAEFFRERRIVVGKRRGERTDRQPGFQRRGVGQFRHERAVDEDQPAAFDVAEQLSRRLRAGHRRGIGRSGERLGIAHQRAQVGVLPVLDAAMRQALAGEQVERGRALFGDRRPAGQPLARLA